MESNFNSNHNSTIDGRKLSASAALSVSTATSTTSGTSRLHSGALSANPSSRYEPNFISNSIPDFLVFQDSNSQSMYSPLSSPGLSAIDLNQHQPQYYPGSNSHANSSLQQADSQSDLNLRESRDRSNSSLNHLLIGQQQLNLPLQTSMSLQPSIDPRQQVSPQLNHMDCNQYPMMLQQPIQSPQLNLHSNQYPATPDQSPQLNYLQNPGQFHSPSLALEINQYPIQQPLVGSIQKDFQFQNNQSTFLKQEFNSTPYQFSQFPSETTKTLQQPLLQFSNHGRQRSFSMMEFSTGSEFMLSGNPAKPTRQRAPTDNSLSVLSHEFGLDLNPGVNLDFNLKF